MLSRVAQRKRTLRQLNRSYDQLSMPWLCPAISRCQSQSSRIRTLPRSSALPALTSLSSSLPPQSARSLATAAPEPYDMQTTPIPFEGVSYQPPDMSSMDQSSGSEIPLPSQFPLPGNQGFSHDSLIIKESNMVTRPKALKRVRGVGGEIDEMLANLDVCLSVHMYKRASLLVHRISKAYGNGSPETVDVHNKYLRSMISHMIMARRHGMVFWAQKWFEVDMKHAGCAPDATSFAFMIKMCLRLQFEEKQARSVSRYWKLATEADVEEEVLGLPILSESDLGLLSEIVSADQPLDFSAEAETKSLDEEFSKYKLKDTMPNEVPEVLAVGQKGLGLSTLKDTLSIFDPSNELPKPTDLEGTPEEQELAYAQMRQRRLETDSVTSAIARWRKEVESMASIAGNTTYSRPLASTLHEWHVALTSAIEEELNLAVRAEDKATMSPEDQERYEMSPYLRIIGTDKLAALTILATFNAFTISGLEKGTKLSNLVTSLGKAVNDEFLAMHLKEMVQGTSEHRRSKKKYVDKLMRTRLTSVGSYTINAFKEKLQPIEWSPRLHARIGATLTSALINSTKVHVPVKEPGSKEETMSTQPAFRRVYQLERGHRIGFVHIHENLVEKVKREPPAHLLAKHLPMVCPPRPWTGTKDGGFLTYPSMIMRVKDRDRNQAAYVKTAAERGDLDQIYRGLTVLGKTGWKINRRVLDVMLEAWNSGEAIANLAPANPDIPDPPMPTERMEKEEAIKYYRAKLMASNVRSGLHSQRCFQNFQMEIARSYRNETFYFPHNLDFRGRAYPLVPYFNQMGADNCRGLLLFSKGRELGVSGLRWLKIHLANVFGFDKASLSEREQFTMDHLDDVMDSADNGLKGRRWWLDAGDPFQCLAACVEVTNAMRLDDPTKFVSHLPVHQDGSCNGLQHYAALGGDLAGAQQVNLEPSDRPADIYTGVADHVDAAVKAEAAKGDKIAKLLDGKITRKIVKQTVMTNVYGVTFLGAIRQVKRQLTDHYPDLHHAGDSGPCATYVARKIFAALGSMFNGAHGIQFWLGDCANRISQSLSPEQIEALAASQENPPDFGKGKVALRRKKIAKDPMKHFKSTVIWTTPLKFPVVQPYRDTKSARVLTGLQHLSIRDPHTSDVVSRRKQLQAFPPNFVHSLDATHMLLSAAKCDEVGLNFSAIHDSFWTHAADIDTMNVVLRDAFILMHSDDIVQRLASEFKARYGHHLYLGSIKHGSPLAKKIESWRRAQARGTKQDGMGELMMEYKRLQLLQSDDPEEQAKGRAMVTAGSIVAEFEDAESSFASVQSLGVAGIGHVPSPDSPEALNEKNVAEAPSYDLGDPNKDSILYTDITDFNELLVAEAEAGTENPAHKKTLVRPPKNIRVWLPLTFKEIPPKGSFDVKRLKDSQYFFS
ncbi:DNA-directed RNA polymerase [Emmonsiellopsis sp. PD_33]|nr:DNA-directed RNA polymerase [Emmonsiellopsis sp. PD_33]